MNATLKAICNLLRHESAELQRAAALVLAQIHPREAGVSKALGEALATVQDPAAAEAILSALQKNPHEQSIRYLLGALERNIAPREVVRQAVAGIGSKAVASLRNIFPKASREVQSAIAEVMPLIRTDSALSFFAEILFAEQVEVVKAAIHALREEVGQFNKKQKNELLQRLKSRLGDKRIERSLAARSAVVICLGLLTDIRAKKLLLPFLRAEEEEMVRRHALMSLARLEYAGEGHGDAIKALLPLLEGESEAIARHAVEVLVRIKPRRSDAEALRGLLASRHSCAQAYAIQALGRLDTVAHARQILDFLRHQDRNLGEAARAALSAMHSATDVLLQRLQECADEQEGSELIPILRAHADRIPAKAVQGLVKALFEAIERTEAKGRLLREAILAVDGPALKKAVFARVASARTKKDYIRMRDCLKLLRGTPFMTPDLLFQLSVVWLKTSSKEIARAHRTEDPALELVARLLREQGKGFARSFLSEKLFEAEDYYYAGYHFSERLNEERRFGADALRHVLKKYPRSKVAKAAREKLKVEGH